MDLSALSASFTYMSSCDCGRMPYEVSMMFAALSLQNVSARPIRKKIRIQLAVLSELIGVIEDILEQLGSGSLEHVQNTSR